MQIQKDDIRKTILNVARQELMQKGFKNASMRNIARETGVSLSNIYNYFRNKDEIFREVLSSLLNAIDKVMAEHNDPRYLNIEIFNSEEYIRFQIEIFVQLIDTYKDDFKLLLFKASGSELENYREHVTEVHTQKGKEYMTLMKQKYPAINSELSPFFIHTMSSWWISIISELVMHDLTRCELETFIREYMEFVTAGWMRVMRIDLAT